MEKKGKGKSKINDLPGKPASTKESESVKGGVYTGGLKSRGMAGGLGATAITFTGANDDEVDEQ